jgi:hypothetical protein
MEEADIKEEKKRKRGSQASQATKTEPQKNRHNDKTRPSSIVKQSEHIQKIEDGEGGSLSM